MMSEHLPAGVSRSRRSKKRSPRSPARHRVSRLELLEPRCVLASPTLATLGDVTLYAGTTLNIALDGQDTDGDALSYTASSTNSSVVASISDSDNRTLAIVIDGNGDDIHGTILLQLFEDLAPATTARIIELAESGFYDGLTFHRIIEDFMIQGGDPTGTGSGGSGTDIDDEYADSLQFTSRGLLAMAKSLNDTGDSQFFITCDATRWLDYHHTIFGKLTEGDDILAAVEAVATDDDDAPLNSVLMTSVSVIQDTENGVLRISAPEGVTGAADVTVQVSDGHGGTATRTFHVTIAADTTDEAPYLESIDPVTTTIDTPVTFTIPATDADGDTMYYSAAIDSGNSANTGNISVSVNSTTGQVTVTPASGAYGVYSILVKVAASQTGLSATSAYSYDSQVVPVYVTPSAPVIERLLPASDSGSSDSDSITSLDNSTSSKTLTFRVSGLMTGCQVTIYADGTAIGQTVATDDTMDIQTSGSLDLTDGAHTIAVVQTLTDRTVEVGNLSTTADLDSPASASLLLTVDTRSPKFLTTAVTRAGIGIAYSYDVRTDDEESHGATYELLEAPDGMTINATTGLIRWTPTTDQEGSYTVKVQATDAAGNVGRQQFTVTAAPAPVVQATSNQVVDQDALLEFTVVATGEHQPLTYSLGSGAPAGATIDSATGVFRWTPTAADAGATYAVVVRATDSVGQVGESQVQIVVRKVVAEVVAPGDSLSISMATSDAALAGQIVQYSLLETPPDGMTIDPDSGLVTWSVPNDQATGTIRVVVRATAVGDDTLYSEEVLNLTIASVPQLQPLDPSTVALSGSGFSVQIEATADVAISFRLVGSYPDGLSIDPVTGELTWTPTPEQGSGQFSFTVRVENAFGQADQQTYTLVSTSALPGDTVSVSLQTNEPALADKSVEYAIVGDVPEGLTLDSQTGQVSWTVPADFQLSSAGGSQAIVVVVRATASQDGLTVGFSDQILQVNVSKPSRILVAALGELLATSAPVSPLSTPAAPSAPVDVAASAMAFAQEASLPESPWGVTESALVEGPASASPLGTGRADLFGYAISSVTNFGDNGSIAPIASSGKQFEEFAPKKQLEQNSDRDRQAQLPPPQPEETQQANRARRHDIPPTHADQSQRAEGGSPPSRVTPQGADAVVRAMSTEAAAEEEALALAPAEDAEQDA